MRIISGNAGSSRLASLIYLLILVLAAYAAVKVVPLYLDYYDMEDEVNQQLHLAQINPRDMILGDLRAKAGELELPVGPEDILLYQDEKGHFAIRVGWTEEVDFGYGIKRDFSFEIDTSAEDM